MGTKIFYNFEMAVDFLRHYEQSTMDYAEMFRDARVTKVEVALRNDRPERASFHTLREGKSDITKVTF